MAPGTQPSPVLGTHLFCSGMVQRSLSLRRQTSKTTLGFLVYFVTFLCPLSLSPFLGEKKLKLGLDV